MMQAVLGDGKMIKIVNVLALSECQNSRVALPFDVTPIALVTSPYFWAMWLVIRSYGAQARDLLSAITGVNMSIPIAIMAIPVRIFANRVILSPALWFYAARMGSACSIIGCDDLNSLSVAVVGHQFGVRAR